MTYTSASTLNMSEGIGTLFAYVNDISSFWFGNMLFLVIWVLFLMGYLAVNKDDYAGGIAVSSYIVTILGAIGWIINLIPTLTLSLMLGVSLVSSAWLLGDRRGTA